MAGSMSRRFGELVCSQSAAVVSTSLGNVSCRQTCSTGACTSRFGHPERQHPEPKNPCPALGPKSSKDLNLSPVPQLQVIGGRRCRALNLEALKSLKPGHFGEVPGSTRLAGPPLGRDRADPHRMANAALLVHAPCPCTGASLEFSGSLAFFRMFWALFEARGFGFRLKDRPVATSAAGIGLLWPP